MQESVNPLQALRAHGQSAWLDFLSRDLLASGELGRLIAQDGLGGVTAKFSEQWDYYRCPAGCGAFQYRHRTRRVKRRAA